MKRVKISLLLGLLALVFGFFVQPCFAYLTADCVIGIYSIGSSFTNNSYWLPPTLDSDSSSSTYGQLVGYDTGTQNGAGAGHYYFLRSAYFLNGNWYIYTVLNNVELPSDPVGFIQVSSFDVNYLLSLFPSCASLQPICDINDSDNDGVCNSCDKNPGAPDPNDCIYLKSVNAKGQTVDLIIDEGCTGQTGSNLVSYRNEANALDGGEGKLTFDLTPETSGLSPKSCNASTPADDQGQCACAYPSGSPLAGFTDVGPAVISDTAQEIKENIQAADDQGQLNDCPSIISRCEASCANHGGVKNAQCNSDTVTNKTTSNCYCNGDNLSYGIIKTSDGTFTDSDGDGIPDVISGAQTGGPDVNNDGVDDNINATSTGTSKALSDSGIPQSLNNLNNNVSSVGNKIDSVADTVSSINNKLGSGIVATGDAPLPSVNNYDSSVADVEENSLADAISNFFTNGLPLINYFKGTYIIVDSAIPNISTEIFGKIVTIDFSGTEDILHYMGLVLVMISTVIAFIIIVSKR